VLLEQPAHRSLLSEGHLRLQLDGVSRPAASRPALEFDRRAYGFAPVSDRSLARRADGTEIASPRDRARRVVPLDSLLVLGAISSTEEEAGSRVRSLFLLLLAALLPWQQLAKNWAERGDCSDEIRPFGVVHGLLLSEARMRQHAPGEASSGGSRRANDQRWGR
jgi:hypothetical protein